LEATPHKWGNWRGSDAVPDAPTHCSMGEVLAKHLIFPAPDVVEMSPHDGPSQEYVIWDERPSGPGGGQRRPFLWVPHPGATTLLIYFHGNAEDLGLCEQHLLALSKRLQVTVLAVEYPGYGLLRPKGGSSGGFSSCSGESDLDVMGATAGGMVHEIDQAAVHALRYAVFKGMTAPQVLLVGRSLGTGPALRLAKHAQDQFHWSIGGIILQSPFISIRQVARDYAGSLGACLVPNYYDNLETLRQLCCEENVNPHNDGDVYTQRPWIPLLILHGERDETISSYHGRALYEHTSSWGHPAVQAEFPNELSHSTFTDLDDLVNPIASFLQSHFTLGATRQTANLACMREMCKKEDVAL